MPAFYGWDDAPISPAPSAFTVVGFTNTITDYGNLTLPVGSQSGDLVIVFGVGNRNLTITGMSFISGTYTMGAPAAGRVTYYARILTGTGNISVSGSGTWSGHVYGIVIRGVGVPGVPVSETPIGGVSASTTTLDGFSKDLNSTVLLCVTSRNNTTGDVGGPSGWTDIVSSNAVYSSNVSYLASPSYSNNASIVADLGAGTGNGGAFILELNAV